MRPVAKFFIPLLLLATCLWLFVHAYGRNGQTTGFGEEATSLDRRTANDALAVAPVPVSVSTTTSAAPSAAAEVQIAVATDGEHDAGLVPLLRSIAANTRAAVTVHLILTVNDGKSADRVDQLRAAMACHGFLDPDEPVAPDGTARVLALKLVRFDAALVQSRIRVYDRVQDLGNLASPANYARFFMPQLFPTLDKIIWLDCDTLVLGDIADLWTMALTGANSSKLLAACAREKPNYGAVFQAKVRTMFRARYGVDMNASAPTFNAGVFVANLRGWRESKVLEETFYWMDQQKKAQLWSFGTQPLQLLTLHHRWQPLPSEWNVDGLGWDDSSSRLRRMAANTSKILHFSGARKPWTANAFPACKAVWSKYAVTGAGAKRCLETIGHENQEGAAAAVNGK